MRRRKKPWAKDELLKHKSLVLSEPEDCKEQWRGILDKDKVHIELGTGRGQFITTLAQNNPAVGFVGIEIKEEVLLNAVQKADLKKLDNIKFLWYNINQIDDVFGENEIDTIYINFCDPWPKKRHSKRRLTHRNFLLKYAKILKDNGKIHFKTDSEEMFEFTLNEASDLNLKLKDIYLDLYRNKGEDEIVKTEYEEKFINLGKKIFSLTIINKK